MYSQNIKVVGAGIAGLTTSLALAQQGLALQLSDRASAPQPLGAGIQLGPNAVRLLDGLGLRASLREVGFAPKALRLRRLHDERTLARLPFDKAFAERYGAPYLTFHRADLHQVLLHRCQELGVTPRWGEAYQGDAHAHGQAEQRGDRGSGFRDGSVLIGADGVWSEVRKGLPQACAPQSTKSVAIRGLLSEALNAKSELGQEVTVWVSDHLHVVGYPVSAGQSYSLVLICPSLTPLPKAWDNPAARELVEEAADRARGILKGVLHAVRHWSSWPLYASHPLKTPAALHCGRVALVGDAGHPMRPHMAQGAGMGIEDACVLAACLAEKGARPESALARYAAQRVGRVARVQAAAERAGHIFQLPIPLSWGRDLALKLMGPRLMDQPWLYGGPLR